MNAMIREAAIRDFAGAIARQFKPEKIILFGSYANGHPTPDSDVDLMVIMKHDRSNVLMANEIRKSIRRQFPLDLFVRRPQDIISRLEMDDWFIRDIVERGEVLYEASNSRVDQVGRG